MAYFWIVVAFLALYGSMSLLTAMRADLGGWVPMRGMVVYEGNAV